MINNIYGPPIVMGGDDVTITIPAVMVSNTDGQLMVDNLGSGVNVTLRPQSASFPGFFVLSGNQSINDVIVRDNAGTSEVYVGAAASLYFASNPLTILGPDSSGLFKSTNGGTSWSMPSIALTAEGTVYEPNDIEIGADGKIWMSTTSNLSGDGGGAIFSSSDGTNFNLQHTVVDASRTQISTSPTDAQKIYVLAQGTGAAPIIMEKTDNGFASTSNMALPNDADNNIAANDFCNSQAFYDLVIKVCTV